MKIKWQDLSLSPSQTGILGTPECVLLHACKKQRQNLRRKEMPCRKRNVALKEWRVRQTGKGRKCKQSWKLSEAWECCTEQSCSCKDMQLTLEAEQPHQTNLSTHFCHIPTSACGLKCHLGNVKGGQVSISGNAELGLITQCSCMDGKAPQRHLTFISHWSRCGVQTRHEELQESHQIYLWSSSYKAANSMQKHWKSSASWELNPLPVSYPGLRMQELLSELQTQKSCLSGKMCPSSPCLCK